MGNESSNPIRNMDKRTARREYKEDFIRGIEQYKHKYFKSKAHNVGKKELNWNDGGIKVFTRKRPIFNHEIENGEFDVVTCFHNNIIIHDARMHSDMKRQMLHHHEFEFDEVFSDQIQNRTVYEKTGKPLVEYACKGGFATAMVYGQTGSGKVSSSIVYSSLHRHVISILCLYLLMKTILMMHIISIFYLDVYNDINICTCSRRYF
jgi:hypothetical protein